MNKNSNKVSGYLLRITFLFLLASLTVLSAGKTVLADPAVPVAGWNEDEGKIYYYAVEELEVPEGEEPQTTLVKAVGAQLISGGWFFFAESGELKTGWVKNEDGVRYHQPGGTAGIIGRALTGLQVIDGNYFFFDEKGIAATGWTEVGNHTYFFKTSGELGTIGSACLNKWVKYNQERYYFGKKGRLLKSRWVDSRYVDASGKRLVNTITPDGYQVGANGKKVSSKKVNGWVKVKGKWYYYNAKKKIRYAGQFKKIDGNRYYFDETGARVTKWQQIGKYKYYFNRQGVMQTGEVKIGSQYYYFNSRGRLQISAKVDGYTTNEKGIVTSRPVIKKSVLIVGGHGQGDPGATSSLGQEYLKTREFASMICKLLKKVPNLNVTFYQNGSTAYDMYQRNKAALGGGGSVTGTGRMKSYVKSALSRSSACPKLWKYDYVLEVHFNATGYNAKDEGGNGSIKGFGIYINGYKSAQARKIDNLIVSKIRSAGMPIWGRGSGLYPSYTLLNAKTCQELGVNYSLIETAFIDDRDDMNFYNANKAKMAKAVAAAIEDFLF